MNLPGSPNPEIQFPELKMDEVYAPGCPPGHLPVVMQPRDARKVALFTWSHWNCFPPRSLYNKHIPKIADKVVGKGKRLALVRLFGYTEQTTNCKLQNFVPDYFPKGHLLHHEDVLKRLAAQPHSDYMADDPATARSHAMLWKAVFPPELDDREVQIIVNESPGAGDGEWVTTDGTMGDGQTVFAQYGIDDYKRLIREIEADLKLEVIRRKGDPRAFATEQMQSEGGLTYFELFARDDSATDPALAPLCFEPAKVRQTISEDLNDAGKLVDLLACDWDKPIDASNHPHLLISDACANLINCWLSWDGSSKVDGKQNPFKDFVDVSRYITDEYTPFIDMTKSEKRGGGGWT